MKKIFLLSLSFLLMCSNCFCETAQESDNLIYEEQTYDVWNFALSRHMNDAKWFAFNDPKYDMWVPEQENWDGITMTLQIKDNKLYINKIIIDVWTKAEDPSYMEIFEVDIPEQGLFADWFTGQMMTEVDKGLLKDSSLTFIIEKGVVKEVIKGK